MENNSKAFKEAYRKAEIWAEGEAAIELLSKEERNKLYNALVTVKAYMGIDMRQDFYLGIMIHFEV